MKIWVGYSTLLSCSSSSHVVKEPPLSNMIYVLAGIYTVV